MKRMLSVLMVLLLLLFNVGTVSAVPANEGAKNSYDLALQALKGKDSVTDLYVKITPKSNDNIPPDILKKIQLKSYDLEGKLIYTKNLFNVAASPELTDIKLNDVERYQSLETRIHVQNDQTADEEVLSGKTNVLLKPDLVIAEVQAPDKVKVNEPFSVTANIKELNGDAGAAANVQILDGSNVLNTSEKLAVNAGGQEQASFMLTLAKAGTYSLKVNITGAEPGDYDDSNNDLTFTVEAVENIKTVEYRSHYDYTSDYEINWKNENGESHQKGSSETFGVYSFTPDRINPEEVKLTLTSETGKKKTANVTLSYEETRDGYIYWSGSDPSTSTSVRAYQNSKGTHLEVVQFIDHISSWETESGNYKAISDEYLGAKQTVSVHFDILSDNGITYGNSYSIALTPFYNAWDYVDPREPGNATRNWGLYNSYSGLCEGVPAADTPPVLTVQ
ncbi:CARDB domain-containing protein [Paenibacillus harenae]|uniref:CARDB domain-containing protein n=1 Tax=Paenibacillus harenae TaxID=306543 RepID=A0ABT9TZQ9_PAEHA|nr:CARDB domain-containing protein [Paenibacillus harenae]MDQ0112497.1 hypothetical protein [Paenibacillus harenae]